MTPALFARRARGPLGRAGLGGFAALALYRPWLALALGLLLVGLVVGVGYLIARARARSRARRRDERLLERVAIEQIKTEAAVTRARQVARARAEGALLAGWDEAAL
jgi:hypothetical protein